jgi:CRISPR-associated endonuclease/helicase Cas3
MLEEVEMPPLLLDRIVDRAGGGGALWTAEPRSRGKVDAKAQDALLGIKLRARDLPGRIQAESDGEERVGVHADTIGCLLDGQLPTHLAKTRKTIVAKSVAIQTGRCTFGIQMVFAHSPANGDWSRGHLLVDHLHAVADLGRSAGEAFGCGDWAYFAGLWHDLGKYRPTFQRYIRSGDQALQVSHKLAGAAMALEALNTQDPARYILALCIAGHHGGLPAWTELEGRLKDAAAQNEMIEALAEAPADLVTIRPGLPPIKNVVATLRSEDRRDSAKVFWEILVRFVFSALIDGDWTDTSEYHQPSLRAERLDRLAKSCGEIPRLRALLDTHLDELVATSPNTEVNRRRRGILEACRSAADRPPGIHELTVPTGGGKTLASLAFALRHAERHGLRRVIVVLPYTSIIEQTASVYRSVLGDDAVLEHHSNLDIDSELARKAGLGREPAWHRWKLVAETWDAPVVVTTSVQFLETLHASKPSSLRKLHRVARSVVILDECQTLPVRLLDATCETLRVLSRAFGVTLVTCTATQPALGAVANEFAPKTRLGSEITPIIADPSELFSAMSRVEVFWPSNPDIATSWEELAKTVAGETRALVIVHRQQDARNLTLAIDSVVGDLTTIHLSAAMVPAHRQHILSEIRMRLSNPNETCRVVATNLVEAGVDLDFPIVWRALGGLDSLAQAAGRCNREGKLTHGYFRIFRAPTDPPSGLIPALNTTLTMLRSAGGRIDLNNPAVYREYFRRLYQESNTGDIGSLRHGLKSNFGDIDRNFRIIDDEGRVAVVVRWGGLMVDDLLLRAIDDLEHGHADALAFRRLQRVSVQAPHRCVAEWLASRRVLMSASHSLPILKDMDLYHDRFGLTRDDDPIISADRLTV